LWSLTLDEYTVSSFEEDEYSVYLSRWTWLY